MMTVAILSVVFLMLIALAIRNGHTVPVAQTAFDVAPSAVDGALRVARERLARGEIDLPEYLRISAVLRG